MPITIQIPPELEEKLRESAAKAGMDVDEYVAELLKGKLKPGASKDISPEERELELLQKINLGIPVATWKRYNYLKELKGKEQLDPEEQLEIIQISDQIEAANAERMKFLVELAQLRKVSIENLLIELGINSKDNG